MDNLFFQVVTLIVAVFAFQVFRLENTFYLGSKKHSMIIGALSGLGIAICMTYPVHMGNGFILDLRWIGFIGALFYGGIYGWATCSLCILSYRFYLGGSASFTLPIALVIISAVGFSIRKIYLASRIRNKILLAAGLALFAYMISLMKICSFSVSSTPSSNQI